MMAKMTGEGRGNGGQMRLERRGNFGQMKGEGNELMDK